MNIKVFQNRKIEKDYFYNEGTQNENKSTVLTFEVPLGYEDFSKRIVFITEDGNFWDYIPENKYEIKNNITKYGTVEAYLWLTKDEQDFRSQNFELNFYDNENADDLVPTKEEIDGFKTLIAELDLKIAEVEELKNTIYQLQENVDNALIELDKKQQNYEQRFQNIDNKLKLKLDEVKANPFVKNVQYDNKTATFTFTAYDNTQIIVDLPIEGTVKDGGYDPETQELYLVLVSGQEIRIPVTDLVNDYEGLETATIQILISADNKITANIKGGSITENLLSQEVAAKLNKVIDLTPYITKQESYEVFYTKQEVDEMVKEIQKTNEYQSEIIDQFKNEFKQITLSGDSIYIPDAAELPMELVPYGEPVQTVIEKEEGITIEEESIYVDNVDTNKENSINIKGNTPTQETREGYNKLPYPYLDTSKTINGITFTDNGDGTVTANGTATANVSFFLLGNNIYEKEIPKGFLSGGINSNALIRVINHSNDKYTVLVSVANTEKEIDLSTYSTGYVEIIIVSGTTLTNEIFRPMISEVSGKPYEQYGAMPSVDYPSEVNIVDGNYDVVVGNKNLNNEVYELGSINNITGENIQVSDRFRTKNYFNIQNFSSVTIRIETSASELAYGRYYLYDKNKKMITNGQITSSEFTINTNGATYIRFWILNSITTMDIAKIMLSADLSSYIEHQEQVYPLDTSEYPLYSENDYYYKSDNKWFVHNEFVRETIDGNSSQNIQYSGSFGALLYTNIKIANVNNTSTGNIWSNKAKEVAQAQLLNNNGICVNNTANRILIKFDGSTNYNTNELARQFFVDNPYDVIYRLATPTETEITNPILIEQLEALYNANLYETITNINSEGNTEVLPIIKLHYNFVTPSPSIDRPSEILTVEGSYSTELQNEYATITNTLPLTLTNELLGEIVTLTEEKAKQLNLDGAGKYRRTDWIRVNGKDLTWFMNNSPIQNKITNRFVAAFANNVGDANIVSAYCNILKRKTPNQIWNEDEMAIGQTKSEITIRVPIELTTNADVRAFFEKNNGYILLKQNPVYEKITDKTELEQLSAYDKQVAFFGTNNINTFPTDDLVKAPLKIHATYSKSNKLTIQSLEDRLASLESQVTNLQDNQI